MDHTLDKISNLYSENLSEHGDQSKAVGWPTADSQELRFEKLTQVISEMDSPFSVNDYGCGYGAHLEYLLQKKYCVSGYNGYDLSEEMLNKSKDRLKDFKGDLKLINSSKISTTADFTFVSGTFNVRFEATYDEWKKFVGESLTMINESSRIGFSFNLLSKYVDWEEPHLFYGNPCYWFDYCKVNYSKQVSLLHDYPLYEWTILVRKE
jgi:SAM-dependent methyltransferase